MKNKVLKTIGYIVGITWLFTACALDDEVYGMTMLFINVLCTAYLALFSWANNWWYDLEDYEDEDDEEWGCKKNSPDRKIAQTERSELRLNFFWQA